jgi:hypothetical protein
MSLLKANSVQIGQSATATQNFTLSVPSSPNGTIKLARGNSGATTADILTVDASGNVTTTLANGIVTPAKLSQPLTQATAVPFNSTASIIFTGIPSWAKKISVLFDRITLSGANHYLIRLGTTSGFEGSGYKAQTTIANSGLATANRTDGFVIWNSVATVQTSGMITIANVSSNNWIASGVTSWIDNTASVVMSAGSKTLSTGVLDRIQILSGNGADTFTGGTLNLIYEG